MSSVTKSLLVLSAGVTLLAAGTGSARAAAPPGVVQVVQTMNPKRPEVAIVTQTGEVASQITVTMVERLVIVRDQAGYPLDPGTGCHTNSSGAVVCQLQTDDSSLEFGRITLHLGGGDDRSSFLGSGNAIEVFGEGGADHLGGWDFRPNASDPSKYPIDGPITPPPAYQNGGSGPDFLFTGRLTVNSLRGGTGDDEIVITTPNADAIGGDDNDVISADESPGPVTINGADGRDRITGSPADDTLIGGFGFDVVSAGAGADRIFVRDSENDVVDCATESDAVTADAYPLDLALFSCESIFRRPLIRQDGFLGIELPGL